MAATEKDTKGDKIKTSTFITWIGQKGRKIYETFTFEPGDEMKLAPVLHRFSENCNPRKNIIILPPSCSSTEARVSNISRLSD